MPIIATYRMPAARRATALTAAMLAALTMMAPADSPAATVPLAAAVAADAGCLGCGAAASTALMRDLPTAVISTDVALALSARAWPGDHDIAGPAGIPGEGPLAALFYLGAALAFMGLAQARVR